MRHKCRVDGEGLKRAGVWVRSRLQVGNMAIQNLNSTLLGPVEADQGRRTPLRPKLENTRWAFLGWGKLWFQVQSPSPNSAVSQRKQGRLACSIQSLGVGPRLERRQLLSQAELCSLLSPTAFPPHNSMTLPREEARTHFFLSSHSWNLDPRWGRGGSKWRHLLFSCWLLFRHLVPQVMKGAW